MEQPTAAPRVKPGEDVEAKMLTGLFPWKTWKARRDHRENFLRERREDLQTNEGFLAQGNAREGETALRLLIREIIASDCGLQPESLRADDSTRDLDKLFGQASVTDFLLSIPEGPHWDQIFVELERSASRTLGQKIHLSAGVRKAAITRWQKGESLGTWAGWLAETLSEAPGSSNCLPSPRFCPARDF